MNRKIPNITLHDGVTIPVTGLGTYSLWGNKGVQSMVNAIDNGYRLLDSAYNYENEGTVGEAVRKSGVSRQELTITSKLPGRYHAYDAAVDAIQESLYRANLDYYDLYLIHWPNPKQDVYLEAWQALIDAKRWGLVRSIGVSNFLPEHMERLQKETGVLPTVNQIELHPFFNQEDMRKWHKENGVQTQSWSPLARVNKVLDEPVLTKIASRHEKSVSQVILRWHYQLGSVAIPRSTSSVRQLENLTIFDFSLSEEEMSEIATLTRADGRQKNQDPAEYEEF